MKDDQLEVNRIYGMIPPVEIYEFFSVHQGLKSYGKINLLPDGKIIIIYSAHVPLKGETL